MFSPVCDAPTREGVRFDTEQGTRQVPGAQSRRQVSRPGQTWGNSSLTYWDRKTKARMQARLTIGDPASRTRVGLK